MPEKPKGNDRKPLTDAGDPWRKRSEAKSPGNFPGEIEDAVFAMAFPHTTQNGRMHRMAAAELVIQGNPSESDVERVREAFVDLITAAGFGIYREFPPRSGSRIVPFIVITTEPTTEKEVQDRAADIRNALQQDADLAKTKSETALNRSIVLLNRAKALITIVAALGLAVRIAISLPEKISVSSEGATIEWNSPKPTPPKRGKAIQLKKSRNPPPQSGSD